jgi:hypothetical protein
MSVKETGDERALKMSQTEGFGLVKKFVASTQLIMGPGEWESVWMA